MYDYFYAAIIGTGRTCVLRMYKPDRRVFVRNIVSASILSADFCNLGRDIGRAEDSG